MELGKFKGIGPAYEKRLRKAGVTRAEDLRHIDAKKVARGTGISREKLEGWQKQASGFLFLSDITGIGPMTEKKLLNAGIRSYDALRNADLTEVENLTGIERGRLEGWLEEVDLLQGRTRIRARLAEDTEMVIEKKSLWQRIKEWMKG